MLDSSKTGNVGRDGAKEGGHSVTKIPSWSRTGSSAAGCVCVCVCSNLPWLSNYISQSRVMQPESSLQRTAALSQSHLLPGKKKKALTSAL